MTGTRTASATWVVIDVRVYEITGPGTETEAIDAVLDDPDREPVSSSTSAELLMCQSAAPGVGGRRGL